MTKKRAVLAVPLVILLGVLLLAVVHSLRGAGTATTDSAVGSGTGVAAEPGATEPGAADRSLANGTGGSRTTARQASAVKPMTRAVISTGQVTLHSSAIARSRAEIMRLVGAWGGVVADEQTSSDDHGRLQESTLTLRVPSDRFDDAMTAIGALGEVEQESRASKDVTTEVIDNDARVRAAERSIRQIEALLSRAEKLGDIIAIENELARRQADLDSLKQQQAWLADQTSLSTITVYLSRPVPHPVTHHATGFLAGLERGWHALGAATSVALTALGAVLPFAVLLGVLGIPLWLVVRRRRVAPPAGA